MTSVEGDCTPLVLALSAHLTEHDNIDRSATLWKEWGVFDHLLFRDVLRYTLPADYLRHYKLGRQFKASPNGIYDFVAGGVSFGPIDGSDESDHGVMILQTDVFRLYAYYVIDMGGCPTCGFGMVPGHPHHVSLCLAESAEDLVRHAMTSRERSDLALWLRRRRHIV